MINFDIPFKIYAGCKIVKGFKRSVIYDLNGFEYFFIPNDLAEILLTMECKTIIEIEIQYEKSEKETIHSYFDFLVENELIFFIPKKLLNHFPEISHDCYYPAIISNAIIEDAGNHQWEVIFRNLLEVQCRNIQIRFDKLEDFILFGNFLKSYGDNNLTCIEVFLPYHPVIDKKQIDTHFKEQPLIIKYYIYNSPEAELYYSGFSIAAAIYTQSQEMNSSQKVSLRAFRPEVFQFIEAQNYNLYYNKKTCIDSNGNIKSGLNTTDTFGNLYTGSSLKYIYENLNDAKKYWDISRNKINKCKNCEFRYMCIFDGEPVYDQKNKFYILNNDCGYNPINVEFSN